LPSTIWGIAKTQLTKLKLANPLSQQIPGLIRIGLKRGQGAVYGPGKNIWGDVYVEDCMCFPHCHFYISRSVILVVGDYYMNLFAKLFQGDPSNLAHGREGFYFVSADEYEIYALSERIATLLYKKGKAKAALPTSFTEEEKQKVRTFFARFLLLTLMEQMPFLEYFGTNSRCRADRGRRDLGWEPKKTTKDMFDSLEEEIDGILSE
jgi:hypothetical protein